MSIAVLFADGFEEIEGIAIVDTLRRAEFDVLMAAVEDDNSVTGAHDITIATDTILADLDPRELDAVVLPGGLPGAQNLHDNDAVIKLLQEMADDGKITAALCAAPICLEKAGLLEDRKFTCYPGFEKACSSGHYTAARTETDELIVTGRGPGAAIEFALAIIKALGEPDVAANLRKGMIVK